MLRSTKTEKVLRLHSENKVSRSNDAWREFFETAGEREKTEAEKSIFKRRIFLGSRAIANRIIFLCASFLVFSNVFVPMSVQIQLSSRLYKVLGDHFLVLIKETITKLKVALLFSSGFELEYRSIIRNCMEIEDTWFGLKNHISSSLIREVGENSWFDKKCQINFLVCQLREISEKFSSRLDVENVKNLRACLQLLQDIV